MTCPGCTYPTTAGACTNPGCPLNPSVPEATKEKWRVKQAARASEQTERERLARLRNASYG